MQDQGTVDVSHIYCCNLMAIRHPEQIQALADPRGVGGSGLELPPTHKMCEILKEIPKILQKMTMTPTPPPN